MNEPKNRAGLRPHDIAAVWEQITEPDESVLARLFDMLFPENSA